MEGKRSSRKQRSSSVLYTVLWSSLILCLPVTLKTWVVSQRFTERQNSTEKKKVKSKILSCTLPIEH